MLVASREPKIVYNCFYGLRGDRLVNANARGGSRIEEGGGQVERIAVLVGRRH